jgi:hypothetical protein
MFLTVCRLIFLIPSFLNSPMVRVSSKTVTVAIWRRARGSREDSADPFGIQLSLGLTFIAEPAVERAHTDDRQPLLNGSTDGFAEHDEPFTFVRARMNLPGDSRTEDLVLLLQELDVFGQLPVSAEAISASSGWKIAAISVLTESGIWNGFAHWLYSTLCCVVLQRYAKPAL